jgi:hypothetical protein
MAGLVARQPTLMISQAIQALRDISPVPSLPRF